MVLNIHGLASHSTGRKVWAWVRRSGYGEEGLGMGKKVWLWGRRSGYGEEGLGMGKKVWA